VILGCYLLHFDGSVHGAQHYLGWSVNIVRRVRLHLGGRGARLVRQALKAGLAIELVRVWPAMSLHEERVLKKRAPKRYCPRCRNTTGSAEDAVLALLLRQLRPRA
jgi:predicted GIY-YIG superfamily endonuclease